MRNHLNPDLVDRYVHLLTEGARADEAVRLLDIPRRTLEELPRGVHTALGLSVWEATGFEGVFSVRVTDFTKLVAWVRRHQPTRRGRARLDLLEHAGTLVALASDPSPTVHLRDGYLKTMKKQVQQAILRQPILPQLLPTEEQLREMQASTKAVPGVRAVELVAFTHDDLMFDVALDPPVACADVDFAQLEVEVFAKAVKP